MKKNCLLVSVFFLSIFFALTATAQQSNQLMYKWIIDHIQ
jgi:hypothetical protein